MRVLSYQKRHAWPAAVGALGLLVTAISAIDHLQRLLAHG
jgi:hypothetical protein